jgi:hypothetical protein
MGNNKNAHIFVQKIHDSIENQKLNQKLLEQEQDKQNFYSNHHPLKQTETPQGGKKRKTHKRKNNKKKRKTTKKR